MRDRNGFSRTGRMFVPGSLANTLLLMTVFASPLFGPSRAKTAEIQLNGADGQATVPASENKSNNVGTTAAPGKPPSLIVQDAIRPVGLEEVVVTGSRIPLPANDVSPDVKIYSRDQIDQSGVTSIADFLNTLPEVSLAITENGFQTLSGTTTVQLHGLPIGTTLVLLDGRRVGTSGAAQGYGLTYFDLNTIPLAAIDRIEVVSQGSSAVYGSDAIAGVVNFILKKDFNGIDTTIRYGFASGTHEEGADFAWGQSGENGSLSVIASYLNRTELPGYDRALTNDNNYTRYGGPNVDLYMCPDQANIYSLDGSNLPGIGAPYASVPAGYTGTPSQQEFLATAGSLSRCSFIRYASRIQGTERGSILAQGAYQFAPATDLYSRILYSDIEQYGFNTPLFLYGAPGFQQYSVGAANPFNPFGETVGVSEMLSTLGRAAQDLDTHYLNAVLGMRGRLSETWSWDVGISDSEDHSRYTQPDLNPTLVQADLNSPNPSTALNPFVAASPGSLALLGSFVTQDYVDYLGRATVVNAIARGPLFNLPGGPLQSVIGGEFERDTLFQNQFYFPGPNQETSFHRRTYAFFTEERLPIIGPASGTASGDMLAVSLAARYDHDDEFGGKSTPQLGAEFRPLKPLLLRASYSRAFRAPDLVDLYAASQTFSGQVADPLKGNTYEEASITTGGNPKLQPITGFSRVFGFEYSAQSPDLHVSITHWSIEEANALQQLQPQVIVDNASLFPGAVTRATSCQGAPPCPITSVVATYLNFGNLDVAGLDYRVLYRQGSAFGTFTSSIAATQTYRYEASLSPASPAINAVSAAQDTGNWAPRWKGTAALDWRLKKWSAHLDGRYVARYEDYHSTNMIGNFWLTDASVRYDMGQATGGQATGAAVHNWGNLYARIGAVNLFNRLPQFSNYEFGSAGYDPTQADIRGRFLYMQIGGRW
ncbi:MAG: TonB-dependent receptor plug domain-containing protein [Steroidobacteraceae bacterium]|jgi:iron complex outermembrane recepter protein